MVVTQTVETGSRGGAIPAIQELRKAGRDRYGDRSWYRYEQAGVTLIKGDLMGIVRARGLSEATLKNIKQNLFFAFIYNAMGVSVAAGILYPTFGILLSPIIAAAAMSLSSVSVIANALRLKTVRLE